MTKPTHRKIISPFTRDRSAFSKFVLRERDREIVRLVFEHRFLDTELLWHLLRKNGDSETDTRKGRDGKLRPVSYGFGRKALYKRLQALYHTGYLDRKFPKDQPIGRGYDGPRAIYSVGPKSTRVLPEMLDVTAQQVRRIVASNRVGDSFMRHAVEIARFRVILELACQRSIGTVRVIFWEQGQHLREYTYGIDHEGNERRFSVYPDAFFALEVKGKGIANYFLEIDRGTEPITSTRQRTEIRSKLVGYRLYRKHDLISKRYAYASTPDGSVTGLIRLDRGYVAAGEARLRGFSVLFVTGGSSVRGESPPRRIANILGMLSGLGQFYVNTSLYMFASSASLSLEEPKSIFGDIWTLSKPGSGQVSLIG